MASGDAVTFTGTGLAVLGPKNSDQGKLGVKVDSVAAGSVDTYRAEPRLTQQRIYEIDGFPYGQHAVTLTKNVGEYAVIDCFIPNYPASPPTPADVTAPTTTASVSDADPVTLTLTPQDGDGGS